jgi:uncharacterized protein with HEPN domain
MKHEAYLRHILEEADYLIKYSSKIDYDVFIQDENLRRSFVRSLEVIGEAVKNVPDTVKEKHNDVPWKKISGMRDILIHHYFGVNYKMVWDVVKNHVPELRLKIKMMLETE